MRITPEDLIGVAIAKLSMAPTDTLLVLCPDWTLEQVALFQGWIREIYPLLSVMFLPGNSVVAIAGSELEQQLRMLETLACVLPSQLN